MQTSIYRTNFIEQQNLENFQIAWLDANINKTDDNSQTISRLRATINYLNIFDNVWDCYDYIAGVQNEKLFLIVSVRGVYTNMNDICEQLSKDVTSLRQFLFMNILSTNIKEKEINKQEASFMYFQLLTEILIGMEHEDDAKTNMINHCRLQYIGNEIDLKYIDEFDKTYSPNEAIWWYTRHCFLFEILNKALRIQDIDILFKYRFFFLTDLHNQIKQLHSEFVQSFPTKNIDYEQKTVTVYRGQGINVDELENLMNNLGGLLSFNNFLSTSTNPKVALMFLPTGSDLQSVLFEIIAEYRQDTKPFCSIKQISKYNEEEEVLFSIGSIFRIESVDTLSNGVMKISLTLTTQEDEQLKQLRQHDRMELGENLNLNFLGLLMIRMGEYKYAQQYFTTSIQNHQPAHPNISQTYNYIALVHAKNGEYNKPRENYESTLENALKSFSSKHPSLATTYNNIGLVHHKKGGYDKALENYERKLEIQIKSFPSNHRSLATTYNSMGLALKTKGEYDKALENYKRALETELKSFPSNHRSLATTYTHIGLVLHEKGEYDKALENYERKLEIQIKSFPSNHLSFATTYNNIGSGLNAKGKYDKALENFQRTREIQLQSLPCNHPALATTYHNIGSALGAKGEYAEALENYERVLDIVLKSLPSGHPALAAS
ncbi:unnamed protein product [Didymodactylos carnosus]|uniref:ADP ribosyltransferase domain-containing protein n=1 Tax=Didymodactylos carnosus TaxID=1234261 RepID=A0A815RZN1_9BILA|nr:unnamed protein product [Didymodactylos carnosus]CAF4348175.1 unnamed protein product [Didymodactylos carnosus]